MSQQREIRALTGLRGVAALYVVAMHFTVGAGMAKGIDLFMSHGYLAVDLFFVLSGFVMAINYTPMFAGQWSMSAYLKFLGRRIARVYPLYLVCTLCGFWLIEVGNLPRMPNCTGLRATLGLNLAMMQVWGVGGCGSLDTPAWSISAEWAAYLLFPLLLVPALLRKPWAAWITACVCVLTVAWLCLLSPSIRHNPNVANLLDFTDASRGLAVVRCLAEFVLGLLAYRVTATKVGRSIAASRWIAPVVCLLTIAALAAPKLDLAFVLLCPVSIVCLAAGDHFPNRILSSRLAEYLGGLSYSIYLIHLLLGGLKYWIQTKLAALGMPHAHVFADAARIALLFGIGIAAHRFIEVPGRRWLRRLFERDVRVVVRVDQISTG
jgi:peptidoglycan/LPS O-acetylase OafA/YrhL